MKLEYSLGNGGPKGRPARKPIEVVMTPMIDVIFLLLVFFLATSSFQVVEKLMPSGVSETKESAGSTDLSQEISDDAIEQIVIKLSAVDSGAQATMNGVAVEQWDDLQMRLRSIAIAQASVPVIIDPESAVKAKFVVQAYDWSRQAGLDRVYLAVRQ